MADEAMAKSRYTFNLTNNAMLPVVSITGSKTVDIYAKPTGGSLYVTVYNGKDMEKIMLRGIIMIHPVMRQHRI